MAVTPLTGFKTFIFDGEASVDYGVQILGKGTFNAPERAVEMVTIPGRNGALAIDQGRYENIEVPYQATLLADSTIDFAAAIAAFRNFLCSRKGYCRLQDEYNPDEYRMAIYKSGLEADVKVLRSGEFDIVFECKPQRYLLSGEEEVEIATGESIINPTLYDAEPLLAVDGYGTIEFNGYEIEIENATIGDVLISGSAVLNNQSSVLYRYDPGAFNTGDDITIKGAHLRTIATVSGTDTFSDSSIYYATSSTYTSATLTKTDTTQKVEYDVAFPDIVLDVGTDVTIDCIVRCHYNISHSGGSSTGGIMTLRLWIKHDSANGRISVYASYPSGGTVSAWSSVAEFTSIIGESTESTLGSPTYIDCDLGEVYMIKSGEIVSLNQYVDLGSDLPKLAPGANEFTIDNTVTELVVTPRFWQL